MAAAMRRILAQGAVAHVHVTGGPQTARAQAADAILVAKPFTMMPLETGIGRARTNSQPQP